MVARPGLGALLCLSFCCLPAVVAAPATGAAPGVTSTYLVAGVPGSSVDVLVDGEIVERGVEATSVIGPVDLTAGSHTVVFRSSGWSARTTFDTDATSVDVVAHRPADATADPTITVFDNDVSPLASSDQARLTVAHVAVVPPADVRASGEVLFENIANGEFVTAEVPATTYSVDIVPTGGSTPVFGPVDVTLEPGKLTRVFAVGDPQAGTMDAVVQVLGVSTPPTLIDSGVGTVDDSGLALSGPALVVIGLALLALAAALRGISRSSP